MTYLASDTGKKKWMKECPGHQKNTEEQVIIFHLYTGYIRLRYCFFSIGSRSARPTCAHMAPVG